MLIYSVVFKGVEIYKELSQDELNMLSGLITVIKKTTSESTDSFANIIVNGLNIVPVDKIPAYLLASFETYIHSIALREDVYVMLYKDFPLVEFEVTYSDSLSIQLVSTPLKNEAGIVLPFKYTEFGSWLNSRPLQLNREYLDRILISIGFLRRDRFSLLTTTRALSVSDQYWIKSKLDPTTWDSVNLYNNRFRDSLLHYSLYGESGVSRPDIARSPDITTSGMLAKAWVPGGDNGLLYKRGTSGFVNAGFEPVAEVIAATVCRICEIPHVDYWLEYKGGILCSVCENMTDINNSYIPFQNLFGPVSSSGEAIRVSPSNQVIKMDILDFIIGNTDRHTGNFGFIYTDGDAILKDAPLFDHGMSLLYNWMSGDGDDWISDYRKSVETFDRKPLLDVALSNSPKLASDLAKRVLNNLDNLWSAELVKIANKKAETFSVERQQVLRKFIEDNCRMILSGVANDSVTKTNKFK